MFSWESCEGACLPFLIPAGDRADLPLHHWKGCIRGPRAAAWRNERQTIPRTARGAYDNLALSGALPTSSAQPWSGTQHSNRGESSFPGADFPKEIIAARPRAAVSNGSIRSEPQRSDRPELQLLSRGCVQHTASETDPPPGQSRPIPVNHPIGALDERSRLASSLLK